MADEHPAGRRRRRLLQARPLYGYRDIGAAGPRDSPRATRRAWVILAGMIVIYLAIMLTIYFVEPGLR
jgi:hypothetical protein